MFELLCEVYEFVDFCVGFVVCDCFVGELDVVCDWFGDVCCIECGVCV